MYSKKDIIATIFLKDGMLVKGFQNHEQIGELESTIRFFNNSGIDKIVLFDLSDGDKEHEKNLRTIKKITDLAEVPIYVGGHINTSDDIKKILFCGCQKVILNSLKKETANLAKEGAERFGKNKIVLSLFNVDVFFKQQERGIVADYVSELFVLDAKLAGTMGNVTVLPYSILIPEASQEKILKVLTSEDTIKGISCMEFSGQNANVMELKQYLSEHGVSTDHLTSSLKWSSFKLNSDGMIPVIVQDYKTNEVLMLAYMNEESYNLTINTGKMTYYSRSRQEIWLKGLTSGHFQYVKSLDIDCDNDTILAKVSQVGAACHTGNRSCFFTNLAKEDFVERDLSHVLEKEYAMVKNRKENPKQGSYTNYLFDKGLDMILKKMGEEATDIVIAAKNPDKEYIKDEIADFIYHMMVMMVERGVTMEEVLEELAMR